MKNKEQERYDAQYKQHLRALKLQGMSASTIDVYARAVRRLAEHHHCCPDRLSREELEIYFEQLIDSHSWSTVKIDRNGLQFFWKHVLKQDWEWIKLIKVPKVQSLPDLFSQAEIERLMNATKHLRYRVFILTCYSMGLRLSETLKLQVRDIDSQRMKVHIRRGKGHKDRLLPLPKLTHTALRMLWRKHRHPYWLFPNARGNMETIARAETTMNRGSTQAAFKQIVNDCGIKKKSRSTHCATATPPTC